MSILQKYDVKEEHKKVMEKYLGTIWKPIKTLKKYAPSDYLERTLESSRLRTNWSTPWTSSWYRPTSSSQTTSRENFWITNQ